MSTIDITNKKLDVYVDVIKCYRRTNRISQARVNRLRNSKRGVKFTDTDQSIRLYIHDEQHAKDLKKALDLAIKLGWFNKEKEE